MHGRDRTHGARARVCTIVCARAMRRASYFWTFMNMIRRGRQETELSVLRFRFWIRIWIKIVPAVRAEPGRGMRRARSFRAVACFCIPFPTRYLLFVKVYIHTVERSRAEYVLSLLT